MAKQGLGAVGAPMTGPRRIRELAASFLGARRTRDDGMIGPMAEIRARSV